MVEDTTYWKESLIIQSIPIRAFTPHQLVSTLRSITPCRFVYTFMTIMYCHFYIYSGKLRPVIYLLSGINWVAVSPISQRVYLKLPFLRINPYTISTRQGVYLVTIRFTITYNFLFINEYEAIYRTSTVILLFLTLEKLLQP